MARASPTICLDFAHSPHIGLRTTTGWLVSPDRLSGAILRRQRRWAARSASSRNGPTRRRSNMSVRWFNSWKSGMRTTTIEKQRERRPTTRARLCQYSFCDYASGLKPRCFALCDDCSGELAVFSFTIAQSSGPAIHVPLVLTQSPAAADARPYDGPRLKPLALRKFHRVRYGG